MDTRYRNESSDGCWRKFQVDTDVLIWIIKLKLAFIVLWIFLDFPAGDPRSLVRFEFVKQTAK